MENTLALQGDEGREWRRNASGSCQTSYYPGMSEWGNLSWVIPRSPTLFWVGSEPGELKHLSTPRKVNQTEIFRVVASEMKTA